MADSNNGWMKPRELGGAIRRAKAIYLCVPLSEEEGVQVRITRPQAEEIRDAAKEAECRYVYAYMLPMDEDNPGAGESLHIGEPSECPEPGTAQEGAEDAAEEEPEEVDETADEEDGAEEEDAEEDYEEDLEEEEDSEE